MALINNSISQQISSHRWKQLLSVKLKQQISDSTAYFENKNLLTSGFWNLKVRLITLTIQNEMNLEFQFISQICSRFKKRENNESKISSLKTM